MPRGVYPNPMSENIPQTSASERVEEARQALSTAKDFATTSLPQWAHDLMAATEALITPPGVGESEEKAVYRVYMSIHSFPWLVEGDAMRDLILRGYRAGIQAAHESWEPADRPSQEMMLRWLGLDYTEDGDVIIVHRKVIKREEI